MDVEALAVNKISDMIALCQHLKGHLASNDKTPITDGHIDLYDDPAQRNQNLVGRVPVQVKGRTRKTTSQQLGTFRINRDELLAHQRNRGVLYLVVYIGPKPNKRSAHYALLSPFAIQAILEQVAPTQSTISVHLTRLPSNPAELEHIVTLALKTREQDVSLGFDPVLLHNVKDFTILSATELNFARPLTLAPGRNDFALILNTTGGLSLPFNAEVHFNPPDYVARRVDLSVSSGAFAYTHADVRRLDDERHELRLSEGLRLEFILADKRMKGRADLTLEPTLAGRLMSVEFYLALYETGSICLDGQLLPFHIESSDSNSKLEEHATWLRQLAELFARLNVDTHLIEMSTINNQSEQFLKAAYTSIVLEKDVSVDIDAPTFVLHAIGKWHLLLLLIPGTQPETRRLLDPFSPATRRQFARRAETDEANITIPVTAYDTVEPEHFATILNLHLGEIVDAYRPLADLTHTIQVANECLLSLITAANGSTHTRSTELLSAASALNQWMLGEDGDRPYHLINQWQIIARQRGLTAAERSKIRSYKRELARGRDRSNLVFEVACSILLADAEDVSDLTRELTGAERESMRQWPIWQLHPGRQELDARQT